MPLSKADQQVAREHSKVSQKNYASTVPERHVPKITATAVTKRYAVARPSDIKAFLEREHKEGKHYRYEPKNNQVFSSQLDLYIFETAANVGYGVLTQQKIKRGTTIGRYRGKYVETFQSDEYLYNIPIEAGNCYIDASELRDYTALINHSTVPNLVPIIATEDGMPCVDLIALRDIEAGETLSYDYHLEYWLNKFPPFTPHFSDSDISDEINFTNNKKYYAETRYAFNEIVKQALFLDVQDYVVPKLFIAILNNNIHQLQELIEAGFPVDLPALACVGDTFNPARQQQHITALHLACALGRKECIEVLLQANADPTRCLFVTGHCPLALLLMSDMDAGTKTSLGMQIIKRAEDLRRNPFALSYVDLRNPLHYAIEQGLTKLVKAILTTAKALDIQIFEPMMGRQSVAWKIPTFADFDFCLSTRKYDILELLLRFLKNDEHFLSAIKAQEMFRPETLESLSETDAQSFLECIRNVYKNKSQTPKEIEQLCRKVEQQIKKQSTPNTDSGITDPTNDANITETMATSCIDQVATSATQPVEALKPDFMEIEVQDDSSHTNQSALTCEQSVICQNLTSVEKYVHATGQQNLSQAFKDNDIDASVANTMKNTHDQTPTMTSTVNSQSVNIELMNTKNAAPAKKTSAKHEYEKLFCCNVTAILQANGFQPKDDIYIISAPERLLTQLFWRNIVTKTFLENPETQSLHQTYARHCRQFIILTKALLEKAMKLNPTIRMVGANEIIPAPQEIKDEFNNSLTIRRSLKRSTFSTCTTLSSLDKLPDVIQQPSLAENATINQKNQAMSSSDNANTFTAKEGVIANTTPAGSNQTTPTQLTSTPLINKKRKQATSSNIKESTSYSAVSNDNAEKIADNTPNLSSATVDQPVVTEKQSGGGTKNTTASHSTFFTASSRSVNTKLPPVNKRVAKPSSAPAQPIILLPPIASPSRETFFLKKARIEDLPENIRSSLMLNINTLHLPSPNPSPAVWNSKITTNTNTSSSAQKEELPIQKQKT